MPKISIIIPIYQVELYLPRCIDSVLAQTFHDFEVLLIDDGSHDKSGIICDKYAEKDNRIRVFHKQNGGISSARNLGLQEAKGKYIFFIDPDDWIELDTLEYCINNINNDDILRFEIYEKDKSQIRRYIKSNYKSILIEEIISRKTSLSIWRGLYKRELFINNNLWFDTSLNIAEDWLLLYYLVKYSNFVSISSASLYHYYMRNNGCVATYSEKKILDNIKVLKLIHEDTPPNIYVKEKILGRCRLIRWNFSLKNNSLKKIKLFVKLFKEENVFPSLQQILFAKISLRDKNSIILYVFYIEIILKVRFSKQLEIRDFNLLYVKFASLHFV